MSIPATDGGPATQARGQGRGSLVWIASYPKSGNTWVRLILRAATGERMDLATPDRISVSFADRVRAYMEMNGLEAPDPGATRHHWPVVQEHFATLARPHPPFSVTFLKTHNIAGRFDSGTFPAPGFTAGAIYIVRDPRDVAISMAHHYSVPLEESLRRLTRQDRIIADRGNRRAELVTDWGTHVQSWLSAALPARLVLRYEDMLDDPERAIAQILSFCGVGSDRKLVRRCLEATRFGVLSAAESRSGFVEAPRETFFRVGRAGQWKDEDPALFAPVTTRYGPLMAKFGYR